MYEFKVYGKTYQIKYGYGVLYKSDLIDKVLAVSSGNAENPANAVKNLIGLTAELLLEGLQKRHSGDFGYETSEEREIMIRKVCDMIDDYEEESEENNGFKLFTELQEELEKNGFLSQINAQAQQELAEQNSTVVPLDHKTKSRKAGANT